jgi:hypothetical protein
MTAYEMGTSGFAREDEGDGCGDEAGSDGGAAEGGGGLVQNGGIAGVVAEEEREDDERTGEAEELVPLPLGEEPVIAGELGGEDGGG